VNEGVHVLGGVAEAKAGAEEGVALGGALGVEAVVVFVLVKQYSLVDVKDVHVLRIFELILDLAIRDADPMDVKRERIVRLMNHFTVRGVNGMHTCLVFEALGCSLY